MTRTPTIGGNWKMNTTLETGPALARAIAAGLGEAPACEVVVFPPFPFLLAVGEALGGSLKLGAQDCYHQPDGAYTGEVSIEMLKDCGVSVVLTGHSERRHVLGETDELVNAKTRAVLDGGLACVLCIGETLDQREAGQTDAVNEAQLRAGLAGVSAEQMASVTIAYEPVWAIGTGKVATPEDAQAAHARCRGVLADLFSEEVAQATRIQYGGSMKPGNAPELLAQPDIDGGLIGGASLVAADFLAIIAAAAARGG
ncbi:Triosephosphate isomerase [hydrothermal vent metagenome]|uniref:triose-phosphate isomerase n=1 Tax=hydrothermal vent metagenome TaxID=652676 RepID=A0A3B1D4K1_9ZZZZ